MLLIVCMCASMARPKFLSPLHLNLSSVVALICSPQQISAPENVLPFFPFSSFPYFISAIYGPAISRAASSQSQNEANEFFDGFHFEISHALVSSLDIRFDRSLNLLGIVVLIFIIFFLLISLYISSEPFMSSKSAHHCEKGCHTQRNFVLFTATINVWSACNHSQRKDNFRQARNLKIHHEKGKDKNLNEQRKSKSRQKPDTFAMNESNDVAYKRWKWDEMRSDAELPNRFVDFIFFPYRQ